MHPKNEVNMKLALSYSVLVAVCVVCACPVAWVTTRVRTSLDFGGYSAIDPILFRHLWVFFTLLLVAGGWIHVVAARR
jgi:hypothetical protein